MDNYHLTKKNNKWNLTKEGNERASLSGGTKEEAIQQTRKFMSNKVGSVKIHKENGQIQEERTYQRKNDPSKSEG